MTDTLNHGKPIQVFYVEDHPTLRQVVTQYISIQRDIELCGIASTAEEALIDPHLDAADIVLIDLSLPGMNGFELLGRIRLEHPRVTSMILSGQQESYYAQRALESGARGYILKGQPSDIGKGIREVSAGRNFVSPQMQASTRSRDHC